MIKPLPPSAGVQVRALLGELRSRTCFAAKKTSIKPKQYCNKLNKTFKNGPHKNNFFKGEKRGRSYLEMGEDIKVRRSLLIFLRGEEGVSREGGFALSKVEGKLMGKVKARMIRRMCL